MTPEAEKHFSLLKKLISLEEDEENEQIRKEFLELSHKEREARGKALLNLELVENHFSPAEHALTTFRPRDKKDLPLFTLETGDLVTLYAAGIDAKEWPSGTVYDKSKTDITIAFYDDMPEWIEDAQTFELHRSINRVTYRKMRQAIESVSETRNTPLERFRDILFEEKKPFIEVVEERYVKWFDLSLNHSQKQAVLLGLSTAPISLVHGPPGTGKTTVLVELIRQCIERNKTIFVTAPSNTACDNILERLTKCGVYAARLGHPARISESLREYTMDFRLALHPLSKQISVCKKSLEDCFKKQNRYRQRRSPGYEAEQELRNQIADLKKDIRDLRKEVFADVMRSTEVFVGTLSGIEDRIFSEQVFDIVIIDEATQATEPLSWIAMAKAKRVVMAGDHFQLPPTVRSAEAQKQGLAISLFERFYKILPQDFKKLLDIQYRMNEAIMGFSSEQFYEKKLKAHDSVRDQKIENQDPLVFVDTAGKGFEEKLEEGSQSRYNPEEADFVLYYLQQLLKLGVQPEQICIISPYSAQVRLLTHRCPVPGVEIDSVDGFQGREKDVVIVSLVRTNLEGELGFLNDTRRMNVAMTRAKKCLVVVGDSATLSSLDFYKNFMAYAEKHNAHKSIWEYEV